jgi:hypothetical protein
MFNTLTCHGIKAVRKISAQFGGAIRAFGSHFYSSCQPAKILVTVSFEIMSTNGDEKTKPFGTVNNQASQFFNPSSQQQQSTSFFGGSEQSQTTQIPSFSFGSNAIPPPTKSSSGFGGVGAPPFSGFGSTASAAPPNLNGGESGGFGQAPPNPNGGKSSQTTSFSFGSTAPSNFVPPLNLDPPTPNSVSGFGGFGAPSISGFGSTAPAAPPNPNGGNSFGFGGFGQAPPNPNGGNSFGQAPPNPNVGASFSFGSFGQAPPATRRPDHYFPKRIFTTDWDTKPPCAVIVTIYATASYDNLFRAVEQQSPDPDSSIALFEMDYETIEPFLTYLRTGSSLPNATTTNEENTTATEEIERARKVQEAIQQVMTAIGQVEASSVVFNFECCGRCSDSGFSCPLTGLNRVNSEGNANSSSAVIHFVKNLLDAGYMVMFADFSLKALLHDWDASLLGPNPFDRVPSADCNSSMTLAFNAQQLLSCPSAQLQNVGKLNDGISTAELHCLGGTIALTLKEERHFLEQSREIYDLEVLTIAPKVDHALAGSLLRRNANGEMSHRLLTIGEHQGLLGHGMLKYHHAGGILLVSAGHWIELSRLDGASEERVINALRDQYGEAYANEISAELTSFGNDEVSRREVTQRSAVRLVQSSAPCSYSRRSDY